MTRILIINNGLYGGGIQKASTSMATALYARGYQVEVLALYRQEHFFSLSPEIRFTEPAFERKSRISYALKLLVYVRKYVKTSRPDVVLAYGEWTNSLVIIATYGLSIKLFLSDRMSPTINLGCVQNFLKRVLYKRAAGIIAQTEFAKATIQKKTQTKNIIAIPNAVNIINIVDVPKKNQIVCVGRLTVEKGHAFLIEAFALLRKSDWQLLIVGEGPERLKLNYLVDRLMISNKVFFAGHQKDISRYLSESKIFVLPSLSEGFPNALIEAMTVPLPCISANCVAGPSDIIKHGENGILVPPGEVQPLANAMNMLIENKELCAQLAKNAYKIRDDLNTEVIVNRYLKFLLK